VRRFINVMAEDKIASQYSVFHKSPGCPGELSVLTNAHALIELYAMQLDAAAESHITDVGPSLPTTLHAAAAHELSEAELSAIPVAMRAMLAIPTARTSADPELAPPPQSPLQRELAEFTKLGETAQGMSGSQFFRKHRDKFKILFQVFCANRVLCPSNARIESWFSEAARVKPSTRARLSDEHFKQIMVLRASPFLTPAMAVEVGEKMPSSGPVAAE